LALSMGDNSPVMAVLPTGFGVFIGKLRAGCEGQ